MGIVMPLRQNIKLGIAVCESRFDKTYKNIEMPWDEFLAYLQQKKVATNETYSRYLSMSKDKQAEIKDVGGFVGGSLKGGRRSNQTIESRSLITLDLDFAPYDLWGELMGNMELEYAMAIYSTHKHSEKSPRYRLLMPLSHSVEPEAYEAIARKIAEKVGMDYFDSTTFQPARLMFYPSHSQDAEFVFKSCDGPVLDPDEILSEYTDWTDISYWPRHPGEAEDIQKKINKLQQDPLEKTGVIGAFCRTYDIHQVIAKYLPDVYTATQKEDRYTYTAGSTAAGLVVYQDGRFAYSNHSTDPAGGLCLNAFDLVRVHKFPDMDDKKSLKAMQSLASRDTDVTVRIMQEKEADAKADFADDENTPKDPNEWKSRLERKDRSTELKNSLQNIILIMQHDEVMKSIVFNQLADGLEIVGEVPWNHPSRFWRDADDSQLVSYVDKKYGTFSQRNYDTAVTKVADDRSYHPIREYFKSLPPWDGVERLDTLLTDYLGADDNAYTRAVIRKSLCAAYVRVHKPGVKFDTICVLNGGQGLGKSTFISKLGMEWYSDSLNLSDMNDKTAAEKLQGYWIMEIGEMAGMRKADLEKVKAFISRQDDKYRASFGRRVQPHPRQCIFFGTTNSEDGFLRDITGNRRYWCVRVSGESDLKPWDMDTDTVDQIWAEVKVVADGGEKLYLEPELEEMAQAEQTMAMERDDREGLVREYLDTLLPEEWNSWDMYKRREYIRDTDDPTRPQGVNEREYVSAIEIWCECFGKPREDINRTESFQIVAIIKRIGGWEAWRNPLHRGPYGKQKCFKKK